MKRAENSFSHHFIATADVLPGGMVYIVSLSAEEQCDAMRSFKAFDLERDNHISGLTFTEDGTRVLAVNYHEPICKCFNVNDGWLMRLMIIRISMNNFCFLIYIKRNSTILMIFFIFRTVNAIV